MSIASFEGIIENGQIRLPANIRLPERTKVYVVIPGAEQPSGTQIRSPRLADPRQATDFKKTVLSNADV